MKETLNPKQMIVPEAAQSISRVERGPVDREIRCQRRQTAHTPHAHFRKAVAGEWEMRTGRELPTACRAIISFPRAVQKI